MYVFARNCGRGGIACQENCGESWKSTLSVQLEMRAFNFTRPPSMLTVYSISWPPLSFRSFVFWRTNRSKSCKLGALDLFSGRRARFDQLLDKAYCTFAFSCSGSENDSAKAADASAPLRPAAASAAAVAAAGACSTAPPSPLHAPASSPVAGWLLPGALALRSPLPPRRNGAADVRLLSASVFLRHMS